MSRKETRFIPGSGGIDVLMSGVFDLYPLRDDVDPNCITGIEILDEARSELLDRAMWAVVKQKGNDPLNTADGNDYEGVLLGESSVVVLISQIQASVLVEGPGVQASYSTTVANGKEYLAVSVSLTNSV